MVLQYPLDNKNPKPFQPTGELDHANFLESAYAVDFVCEPKTPVIAAAEGEVVYVKDDASSDKTISPEEYVTAKNDSTENQLVSNKTNIISIRHQDGTYTEYIHLAQDSSVVKKGSRVVRGQLIATTGLSGVMDLPHLHFNRFRIIEDGNKKRAKSIPFTMVYITYRNTEKILTNLW